VSHLVTSDEGTLHSPRVGSSSTTSPTSRVRVPRLVARLVALLVVDYFAYAARPGASARRTARLAARPRLVHLRRASECLDTWHGSSRGSSSTTPCATTSSCGHTGSTSVTLSRLLVSRQHWLYFEYAACCRDVVFWSHSVDHSSRLVFQTSREWQSHPQQLVGINSDLSTSATTVVAPSPTATASSTVCPGSNS
jgi:hypothetical protein